MHELCHSGSMVVGIHRCSGTNYGPLEDALAACTAQSFVLCTGRTRCSIPASMCHSSRTSRRKPSRELINPMRRNPFERVAH